MEAVVDGIRIFYQTAGSKENYPLILLHGGPGLDHTEMSPWLDSLRDDFYLIYLDERGQGRSEPVDPSTLSLSSPGRCCWDRRCSGSTTLRVAGALLWLLHCPYSCRRAGRCLTLYYLRRYRQLHQVQPRDTGQSCRV